MHIKVESHGKIVRTGVAKESGKPYIFAEAYLVSDNSVYPERFEYFCSTEREVLPQGVFHVPVQVQLRDGKVYFYVDYSKAQRAPTAVPQGQAAGAAAQGKGA